MATWTTQARVDALPEQVLDLLTQPEAIRRWAPVPFEIVDIDTAVLRTGSHARVAGNLGGYAMTFEVEVHEASPHAFGLTASGPIMIDASYDLKPSDNGSRVLARVSVRGVERHVFLDRIRQARVTTVIPDDAREAAQALE